MRIKFTQDTFALRSYIGGVGWSYRIVPNVVTVVVVQRKLMPEKGILAIGGVGQPVQQFVHGERFDRVIVADQVAGDKDDCGDIAHVFQNTCGDFVLVQVTVVKGERDRTGVIEIGREVESFGDFADNQPEILVRHRNGVRKICLEQFSRKDVMKCDDSFGMAVKAVEKSVDAKDIR